MNKRHFLLYWMQNFSSFISYTGFLTPFKVKTWFFYSINARYYLWEENNNAKMSRSIKILDVPKTFQFSFFFTPVCVYFQKISMARNAIFFLFKCWILKLCSQWHRLCHKGGHFKQLRYVVRIQSSANFIGTINCCWTTKHLRKDDNEEKDAWRAH